MWKFSLYRWHWLAVISLLCIAVAPAKAQWDSGDDSLRLNSVGLDWTFDQVFAVRGAPHFIGPSVDDVTDINNILNPPPLPSSASDMSMMTGAAPGVSPYSGGMMPGMPGDPSMMGSTEPTEIPKTPKLRSDEIVWMYEGNDMNAPKADAGWYTYVIFNRKSGTVESVIVWLADNTKSANMPKLKDGIALGSKLSDLLAIYEYPNAFFKVGECFVCPYKNQQLTFSVSVKTRKIVGIALGDKQLTVIPGKKVEQSNNAPGMSGSSSSYPTAPAGTLPGLPNQQPYTK